MNTKPHSIDKVHPSYFDMLSSKYLHCNRFPRDPSSSGVYYTGCSGKAYDVLMAVDPFGSTKFVNMGIRSLYKPSLKGGVLVSMGDGSIGVSNNVTIDGETLSAPHLCTDLDSTGMPTIDLEDGSIPCVSSGKFTSSGLKVDENVVKFVNKSIETDSIYVNDASAVNNSYLKVLDGKVEFTKDVVVDSLTVGGLSYLGYLQKDGILTKVGDEISVQDPSLISFPNVTPNSLVTFDENGKLISSEFLVEGELLKLTDVSVQGDLTLVSKDPIGTGVLGVDSLGKVILKELPSTTVPLMDKVLPSIQSGSFIDSGLTVENGVLTAQSLKVPSLTQGKFLSTTMDGTLVSKDIDPLPISDLTVPIVSSGVLVGSKVSFLDDTLSAPNLKLSSLVTDVPENKKVVVSTDGTLMIADKDILYIEDDTIPVIVRGFHKQSKVSFKDDVLSAPSLKVDNLVVTDPSVRKVISSTDGTLSLASDKLSIVDNTVPIVVGGDLKESSVSVISDVLNVTNLKVSSLAHPDPQERRLRVSPDGTLFAVDSALASIADASILVDMGGTIGQTPMKFENGCLVTPGIVVNSLANTDPLMTRVIASPLGSLQLGSEPKIPIDDFNVPMVSSGTLVKSEVLMSEGKMVAPVFKATNLSYTDGETKLVVPQPDGTLVLADPPVVTPLQVSDGFLPVADKGSLVQSTVSVNSEALYTKNVGLSDLTHTSLKKKPVSVNSDGTLTLSDPLNILDKYVPVSNGEELVESSMVIDGNKVYVPSLSVGDLSGSVGESVVTVSSDGSLGLGSIKTVADDDTVPVIVGGSLKGTKVSITNDVLSSEGLQVKSLACPDGSTKKLIPSSDGTLTLVDEDTANVLDYSLITSVGGKMAGTNVSIDGSTLVTPNIRISSLSDVNGNMVIGTTPTGDLQLISPPPASLDLTDIPSGSVIMNSNGALANSGANMVGSVLNVPKIKLSSLAALPSASVIVPSADGTLALAKNPITADGANGWIKLGNVLIQWGLTSSPGAGGTVTLKQPYLSTNYSIHVESTGVVNDPNNMSTKIPWVNNTTSSFNYVVTMNNTTWVNGYTVYWMTIGQCA